MRFISTALVCLLILISHLAAQPIDSRARINFNGDWRFIRGDAPEAGDTLSYANLKGSLLSNVSATDLLIRPNPANNPGKEISYVQPDFDDRDWRRLDLPHDLAIEGPFDPALAGPTGRRPFSGVAWYRKTFTAPLIGLHDRLWFNVDGAMSFSAIWLNGHFVGGWPFGWASFQVDLTPFLDPGGKNVIAVRLDSPDKSSRWYPGAGLYRNVWLEDDEPIHVAHWGTFVTTPEVSADQATVSVRIEVQNDGAESGDVSPNVTLYAIDADGKTSGPAVATTAAPALSLAAGANTFVGLTLKVPKPKRWDLEHRNLYAAIVDLKQNNHFRFATRTDFGIRTIKFEPDGGFLLNGKRVQIKGVCDHSDLGALGTIVNVRGLERQIQLLQEMGCNAIRTSHNPPAPELLDLCDRLGMLVLDESFDTWENPKGGANGYNLLFTDWHTHDQRALIRRDRNHPSIILYSAGNEIGQQGSARGNEILKELIGVIHREDPTRMVTTANNTRGFSGQDPADYIYGFNYNTERYSAYHASNPELVLIGSETQSTVSSRGVYTFPVATGVGEKTGTRVPNGTAGQDVATHQVSSYDLYYPAWANSPDAQFAALARTPGMAGEFVWTGFDYLGEPTPFGGRNDPARSSYFGILDLAGFKKDRFYLFQSQWRPELPMVHILPHWNWPERVGQVTPVHVYTSGDEAELFLNGKSQGRKKKGPDDFRLRWDDVVYQPGELRVVAYKAGAKWAEARTKTTGPATQLRLTSDRERVKADGVDLAYVTVTVADRAGLTVPRANQRVKFTLVGPGKILATDNGDATDLSSFQSSERAVFNGLALAIVASQAGERGKLTIRAEAEGLRPAEITVRLDADGSAKMIDPLTK